MRRSFGALRALRGVDLEVPAGTVTALVGPNGAGKTTLMRVLVTLTRADGGRVLVGGRDVAGAPNEVRRQIGYVAHRTLLYPDLTADENLRFYAGLYGVRDAPARVGAVLGDVGLLRRRHDRVRTFSRGTAQRLAIARAVLHEPAVLLLDEPHTGLDPAAAEALDAAIGRLVGRGRTVLFASHDLERAQALAAHVAIMHRGRIVWHGATADLGPGDLRARYRSLTDDGAGGDGGVGDATWSGGDASSVEEARPPSAGSVSFAGALRAIVWKDVLTELRAREVVPPVLVFALLVVVIFQFALPVDPALRQATASGALWVALLFGSTLGLARLMGGEVESGGVTGMLVSPADRGALFAGKWLAGLTFALVVAALLVPAFIVLLGLRVTLTQVAGLGAILALGMVGWTASGVLLGGMAANTRAREVMLPVLLYPLVLPLVIAAVQATSAVLDPAGAARLWPAVALMAAYDVVFWVFGFLLFSHAVGE